MTDNSKFNIFELIILNNYPEFLYYQDDLESVIIKLINNLTDKYNNIESREQIIQILIQHNIYQLLEKLNLQHLFIDNILIRDLKLRNEHQILLGGAEKKKKKSQNIHQIEFNYINNLLEDSQNKRDPILTNKEQIVREFLESMFTLKMNNFEYYQNLISYADLMYMTTETIDTPLFIKNLDPTYCCCNDRQYFEQTDEFDDDDFEEQEELNEYFFLENFIYRKYIDELNQQQDQVDEDEPLTPVSPASPVNTFGIDPSFVWYHQANKDKIKELLENSKPERQQILKRNFLKQVLRNSKKTLFMNDFSGNRRRCHECPCCISKTQHHIKITQLYQLLHKCTIFVKKTSDSNYLEDIPQVSTKIDTIIVPVKSQFEIAPSQSTNVAKVEKALQSVENIVDKSNEELLNFFSINKESSQSNLSDFKTLYEYIIEDLFEIKNVNTEAHISEE
jgi:hypothetical protein